MFWSELWLKARVGRRRFSDFKLGRGILEFGNRWRTVLPDGAGVAQCRYIWVRWVAKKGFEHIGKTILCSKTKLVHWLLLSTHLIIIILEILDWYELLSIFVSANRGPTYFIIMMQIYEALNVHVMFFFHDFTWVSGKVCFCFVWACVEFVSTKQMQI